MSPQATVPIPPGATIGAPPPGYTIEQPTAWDANGNPVSDARTSGRVPIPAGATIGSPTAWDAQGNPVSGSGDVFARLAAEDQARRNASSQNAKDIFDQLAANGGKLPPDYTVEGSSSPVNTGEVKNDIGKTVIVPKPGESFEDTINRAIAYGKTVSQQDINDEVKTAPKKVAAVVVAAPAIGAAGAAGLTAAGDLGELASEYAEYGGQVAKEAIGKIPGLLKSAWDWASANPVKAYLLYKVLEQAGVGPSGMKKVLHIASGAGE